MSAAYAKGAAFALPQAQISHYRLQVIAMANLTMDLVRRAEMHDALNGGALGAGRQRP